MALGIFICLFLPLSQCAGISEKHSEINDTDESGQLVPENELKREQGNDSNIRIIISSIDDVIDFEKIPVFLGFILPLLFCISFVSKKWKILLLILQTVNQGWLIYLTCGLVWFLSEPLWGGYLLTFCVGVYFLITIVEWINLFRKKQQA
jgi:hypothetical protein